VFLGVETNDKRGDVDDLLAHTTIQDKTVETQVNRMSQDIPNVSLSDENTRMMYAFRQSELENLSLQPSLQEIFDLQRQHVIEPHASLVQHANAHKPANEGVALKQTFGVLVVELEEFTSGAADLGQGESDAPDFTLVAETVLARQLRTLQIKYP
jgi:hypothetical protein